jgi:hypothetical protein
MRTSTRGSLGEGMSNRKAPQAQPSVNVALAPKSTVRLGAEVNQGVPDRFSEILRRLDQANEAGTDGKGEDGGRMGAPNKPVRDVMLAAVPSLRAFAISLCGNVDRADDLVQETLLRAWANLVTFEPGTNMPAWLFTILRNLFRSEYRKRRRCGPCNSGTMLACSASSPVC